MKKLVIACGAGELPCRCSDRHNHLNLAKTCLSGLVVRRDLAVLALKREKGQMRVARDIGAKLRELLGETEAETKIPTLIPAASLRG